MSTSTYMRVTVWSGFVQMATLFRNHKDLWEEFTTYPPDSPRPVVSPSFLVPAVSSRFILLSYSWLFPLRPLKVTATFNSIFVEPST